MGHIERHGLGDVLVDRDLSDQEVASFLGRILGLRPDEVYLIEDIEQVLAQPATTRVVCQRTARGGEEYPLLLSLWGTTKSVHPFSTIVAELCRAFDCRCLIDDGSSDPYSWLQLDGSGNNRPTSYYGP